MRGNRLSFCYVKYKSEPVANRHYKVRIINKWYTKRQPREISRGCLLVYFLLCENTEGSENRLSTFFREAKPRRTQNNGLQNPQVVVSLPLLNRFFTVYSLKTPNVAFLRATVWRFVFLTVNFATSRRP